VSRMPYVPSPLSPLRLNRTRGLLLDAPCDVLNALADRMERAGAAEERALDTGDEGLYASARAEIEAVKRDMARLVDEAARARAEPEPQSWRARKRQWDRESARRVRARRRSA